MASLDARRREASLSQPLTWVFTVISGGFGRCAGSPAPVLALVAGLFLQGGACRSSRQRTTAERDGLRARSRSCVLTGASCRCGAARRAGCGASGPRAVPPPATRTSTGWFPRASASRARRSPPRRPPGRRGPCAAEFSGTGRAASSAAAHGGAGCRARCAQRACRAHAPPHDRVFSTVDLLC